MSSLGQVFINIYQLQSLIVDFKQILLSLWIPLLTALPLTSALVAISCLSEYNVCLWPTWITDEPFDCTLNNPREII